MTISPIIQDKGRLVKTCAYPELNLSLIYPSRIGRPGSAALLLCEGQPQVTMI